MICKCKICGRVGNHQSSICDLCLLSRYEDAKRKRYENARKMVYAKKINRENEYARIAKMKETLRRKNEGIIIEAEEPFLNPKCQSCQINTANHEHPCPYHSDVNNDSETLCNCCDECCQECANDI